MDSKRQNLIVVGQFRLDPVDHVLTTNTGRVRLSPLASQFLQVLAQTPGELVAREELVNQLWRGDWGIGDPAINRVVSEIRSLTGDDPKQPSVIQTVPRRGYRLVGTPSVMHVQLERSDAPSAPLSPWHKFIVTILALTGSLAVLGLVAMLARYFR